MARRAIRLIRMEAMGKLIKAAVLLVLLGGVGTYVLVRQFAPGKTPAEKVENTKKELRNVREMVEAALPKAPPGEEGTGLGAILGAAARPEGAPSAPREVEGTVEASAPAEAPAVAPPPGPVAAPPKPAPPAVSPSNPPPAPKAEPPAPRTHVVAAGETLNLIASRYYGSSGAWTRIVEANPGVDPDRLRIGQKLVIPGDRPAEAAPPAPAEPRPAPAEARRTYKIKPGDTLIAIARRELGDENRWKEIPPLNPGMDADRLSAGKEIVLPAGAGRE